MTIWWIIIPGISLLFPDINVSTDSSVIALAANSSPEDIFKYAKSIGIGGIAMAGIIGIIKSWGVIKSSVGLAGKELRGKNVASKDTPRTQLDLPMKFVVFGLIFTLLVVLLFFGFDVMHGNWFYAIVGLVVIAIIAFLFTTVAANAIAIVGSNPVSGMTLMTLILASVIMVSIGLKGTTGMVAALIMGGVVCTALSTAGSFVTDLKIGYWLGTTPRKQETYKFLGTLVSAATVGGVIMILNKTYGFASGQLAAPQANAMAAVIEPLMSGSGAPWLLYGIGAIIAIVLTLFNVSALAFALGMFIPLDLNLPILVGGLINWYVNSRSKDTELNNARNEKGTLIASGFIAGGALMGVVSAAMRFGGLDLTNATWVNNPLSQDLSLLVYFLLIIYFIRTTLKIKN
jgi:putative OPT family oligopeptide transporter